MAWENVDANQRSFWENQLNTSNRSQASSARAMLDQLERQGAARAATKTRGYEVASPKVQRKETKMGAAYTAAADPKKDYEKYVTENKDLAKAFEEIQKGGTAESEYWLRRMGGGTDIGAFGRAHAGDSAAIAGI